MKYFLFIFSFFIAVPVWGQTVLKKSSLSNGGGSRTVGSITVVHTLGEPVVREQTAGTLHLSEGFIGPDISNILGVEDFVLLQGIRVHPNPVKEALYIRFRHPGDYEVYIHDLTGRKLVHKQVSGEPLVTMDLSAYRPGMYLVSVVDRKSRKYVTYKIAKQ